MQYYYECLEVYEKLVPEVKKHCKLLRKLDAKFLVVRDSYLEALSQFEDTKEEMTPSIRLYSKQVIEKGQETLNRITQEKWKTANSLMITIEYYLSRINGYVREFKCEIDSDNTPGTSIEIEKKFLEANRKRVKEIQEIRDEYPFLDDIFKIPEPELESTESAINESMVEPIKINGHRQQNIAVLLQDIGSSFRDDPPGIRSSNNSNANKKNSFKIKTERRGSINGGAGTPSPRAMSPRLPKTPRFPNNNDSTMLTLPEPSPSSNSVSPMEHSNNLSSSVTSAQPRSSRSRKKKKKEKKKLDQAEPQSSRSSRLQNKLDHENQVKSIHKEFYNQSGNPKYSLSLNELHQRLEKENGQSSNIS
uniref:Inhibitor of growth protein N-terminal histone-binding domain-containing protein n=1 Tax=Panagrolaimus sp. PS1159 TaxID=55785 RepID=A0AC35G8I9_9BILA